MPGSRNRLIIAARRSMIQRAELQRKLGVASSAFKPKALLDRGKYRLDAKIDDAAHVARKQFKDNRLPIALAAVAGIAWLFREPIKQHVPRAANKLRDLVESGLEKIRHGEAADVDDDTDAATETDEMEKPDEAAE